MAKFFRSIALCGNVLFCQHHLLQSRGSHSSCDVSVPAVHENRTTEHLQTIRALQSKPRCWEVSQWYNRGRTWDLQPWVSSAKGRGSEPLRCVSRWCSQQTKNPGDLQKQGELERFGDRTLFEIRRSYLPS